MFARGIGLLAAVALGVPALAHSAPAPESPPTSLQGLPSGPGYISSPDWAHQPSKPDLWNYRPETAYRAGVAGGAVVDCVAQADGRLSACKTIEVRPAGWEYEFAGEKLVANTYRLKPLTADGEPVTGKHVVVTVIWK